MIAMKEPDIGRIISILKTEAKKFRTPVVELIEFQTHDPFKVLVTTILSSRTQDQTTARAAKRLFEAVGTPSDLAKLSENQISKLIFPVGFYKTKARHLKQLPVVLNEQFGGKIPPTLDALIQLPGVGRKTANLVMTVAFQKPAICVDTHVHRISNRLGYVKTKTPFETEMALRKKLPLKYWKDINWLLVAFGQNRCKPISPICSDCPIRSDCNRINVTNSR